MVPQKTFVFTSTTDQLAVPIQIFDQDSAEALESFVICLPSSFEDAVIRIEASTPQCFRLTLFDEDGENSFQIWLGFRLIGFKCYPKGYIISSSCLFVDFNVASTLFPVCIEPVVGFPGHDTEPIVTTTEGDPAEDICVGIIGGNLGSNNFIEIRVNFSSSVDGSCKLSL